MGRQFVSAKYKVVLQDIFYTYLDLNAVARLYKFIFEK